MTLRLGTLVFFGAVAVANIAFASTADKKAALIATLNENGCKMTTAQSNVQIPKLGISRTEAIKLSREMMAEGIAKFAADQETLLLLPPACKK